MVATGGKLETAHREMGLREVREKVQTGETDLAMAGQAMVIKARRATKAKVARGMLGKPMTKPMSRSFVKRRLIVGSNSMRLRRN
jgi:hypothetical protein